MDININSQILVYNDLASFPVTGAAKTLYVADDTEKLYRWTGSAYVEVSAGSISTAWGTITGTLSNQTDLQTALNNKEPLKGADDNYVTDAQLVVISNTSGTNSGDNATNTTSNTYADGKVSQVITNGVTDKAPSEDAVFDALALKANLASPTFTGTPLAPTAAANTNTTQIATTAFVQDAISTQTIYVIKDYTDSAELTGSVNNTLMFSVLIPANTYAVGDFIEHWVRLRKTGDNGTLAVRVYYNTSNSLSGATLISTFNSTNTTDSVDNGRIMIIKSATNTEVTNSTTSLIARDNSSTNIITSNNIDWTVGQYFIVAAQNSNAADSTYYSGSYIRRN